MAGQEYLNSASLVIWGSLKATGLNYLKVYTSFRIHGDCRLCVSFPLLEGLSVVSLHRPVRSSSQHVWLVEEWVSLKTELGRNFTAFFNPASEIMHLYQAHSIWKHCDTPSPL